MEKITIEYECYQYDELDEDAKEKALEALCYTNVDYDWWDMTVSDGNTVNELRLAGIGTDERGISFDIDRDNYLFFHPFRYEREGVKGEHQGIWIESQYDLVRALVKDKLLPRRFIKLVDNQSVRLGIETSYYAGGCGKNYLVINGEDDTGYTAVDKLTGAEHDAIADWLSDKLEDLLGDLRKQYEYLTSREAIEDTIRENEYKFSKDGRFPAY